MPKPLEQFQTLTWNSGAYAIARTRDEVLRRQLEAGYDGKRLIIRLRRRKRRRPLVQRIDPDEVNYVSALEQVRNKNRVEIQWAPSPS